MRKGKASSSAALVAALRGFGKYLPSPLREAAPDVYGLRWAGAPYSTADALLARFPALAGALFRRGPVCHVTAAHVLRTRAIDDAVRSVAASGGRQVLILGAGLDARALRLHASLPTGIAWFEVDVPASQAAKRAALASSVTGDSSPNVRYLTHDFEMEGSDALVVKLREGGLRSSAPLLTIVEGVIPYLSAGACESLFALVHSISAPGSAIVFSYVPPSGVQSLSPKDPNWWLLKWLGFVGESPRFWGWETAQLPAWLSARKWKLLWDKSYDVIADELGAPRNMAARVGADFQRVALAMRVQ